MAERATALFNKLSSMPPGDVVNLFANVLSTQFDGLEAHLEKAEQNHEKEKEALQRQIDFLQDENASLRQRLHEAEGRLQADVERAFASLSRVVDFFGTEKMAERPPTLNTEVGGSKQSRKGQTRKRTLSIPYEEDTDAIARLSPDAKRQKRPLPSRSISAASSVVTEPSQTKIPLESDLEYAPFRFNNSPSFSSPASSNY